MQRVCADLRRRGIRPPQPPDGGLAVAAEAAPERFLGSCLGAWEAGRPLALLGADWPAEERAAWCALAREGLAAWTAEAPFEAPPILIPTGGSSGQRHYAVHSLGTLMAAAEGFLERFGPSAAAACSVLPLHHVGGLMSLLRAVAAGAEWVPLSYRELPRRAGDGPRGSLSLVPTQLQRLLGDPAGVAVLREFRFLWIGGAALPDALAARARAARLRLAPCYGMTETAAMVTALEPAAFLAGETGCGSPLPHVRIRFTGATAGNDAKGRRICVEGASLALGLLPGGRRREPWWETTDAGYRAASGSLVVTGRLDRGILTGGETVDPARVEAVLRAIPGVDEVVVFGVPDAEWGERVVAAVGGPREAALPPRWADSLRPAERPKALLLRAQLPRTAMGKIDLRKLQREAQESPLPEARSGGE